MLGLLSENNSNQHGRPSEHAIEELKITLALSINRATAQPRNRATVQPQGTVIQQMSSDCPLQERSPLALGFVSSCS